MSCRDNEKEPVVEVPDQFPFPYAKPYDIQLNFMKSLYKTLEDEKIGIFESPTGTGKSLSLICGSLKWLTDHKQRQKKKLEEILAEDEEKKKKIVINVDRKDAQASSPFDWLLEFQKNFDQNQKNLELKEFLEKQVKQEKSYGEMKTKARELIKQRKLNNEKRLFQNKLNVSTPSKKDDPKDIEQDLMQKHEDADLILDDYQSDEENAGEKEPLVDESQDDEKYELTKIYFCSRTHSQISQFIGELRKTVYYESVRLVTLGSRMNLCINDNVLKLGSIQAINDRCLEMQRCKKDTNKSGSKKTKLDSKAPCDYYKSNELDTFNLRILEDVMDIEEVGKLGRETKICAYYGSRHSIKSAEIIALPYNILFQKDARHSFSINLRNQVIIIDEAHNLIDTIAQIHSVEITDAHVTQASAQLDSYINRYKRMFSAKNMLYLKQLVGVLNALAKLFTTKTEDAKLEMDKGKLSLKVNKLWTIDEFMTETRFFKLNFDKLIRFCEETQLEKKLIGFNEKYAAAKKAMETAEAEDLENKIKAEVEKKIKSTTTPSGKSDGANQKESTPLTPAQPQMKSPLMAIKQFIKQLSSPFYDGRVLLNIDQASRSTSSLKYILLNPGVCFDEIASQARAVILAGGTMKPVSDFEQLVKKKERIEYFSCGHVIPKENLICIGLATGPNNIKFDFSYNNRDNPQMIEELGKQLVMLSHIVPNGIVVFFVSYDYMDKVMAHFKKSNMTAKIEEKKAVYVEPKLSSECDRVFNEYTKTIKKPKPNSKLTGAMLFAVVGGKMSEGINFSDELGRCVVVVGQPYPNIKSLELNEKIQYLNKNQPKGENDKLAGQQYYEGLCWKAINQSIGRAIRHQNDYSSIFLIDARYANQPLGVLRERLPKWIGDSFRQEGDSFKYKEIMDSLKKFFESKNKQDK